MYLYPRRSCSPHSLVSYRAGASPLEVNTYQALTLDYPTAKSILGRAL